MLLPAGTALLLTSAPYEGKRLQLERCSLSFVFPLPQHSAFFITPKAGVLAG